MLSLRRVMPGDLPRLLEIENLAFSDPWPTEAFSSDLLDNGIVLLEQDHVVGYVFVLMVLDECSIINIAIDPVHQRKGYGEYMMKELILALYGSGHTRKFYLEVRASNLAAQKLYEKLGFSRIGLRRGYYSTPPEDAIVMSLILPDKHGKAEEEKNDQGL